MSESWHAPKSSFFWNKVWFTGSSRCSTGEGRPTNLFLIFLTLSSHYTNTTKIIKRTVRKNRLADREDLVFFQFLFPPSGLMELYWLARQKTTLHLERIFCHRSDKEREGEKSHNPNSRPPDCAQHIHIKAVGAPTRLVPPGTAKRLGTLEPRIGPGRWLFSSQWKSSLFNGLWITLPVWTSEFSSTIKGGKLSNRRCVVVRCLPVIPHLAWYTVTTCISLAGQLLSNSNLLHQSTDVMKNN